MLGRVPRIDRIVRQSQGRLLPLGAFGAGRTTLSRSDCADRKICCLLNVPNGVEPGYSPVEQGKRRGYTKARLKGFHKKELDGSLGMLEEGPDQLLKIDRRAPPRRWRS